MKALIFPIVFSLTLLLSNVVALGNAMPPQGNIYIELASLNAPFYPILPKDAPQAKKKKKNKKNNKKNNFQVKYNSFFNILLSAIGLIILPLGIGLSLPWLWILGTVILSVYFILTIIKMIKVRPLAYEGEEGRIKNQTLLLTSTFLTLLGIALLVAGIIGDILILWIIGAIIILPGIVWIITLSCKSRKL